MSNATFNILYSHEPRYKLNSKRLLTQNAAEFSLSCDYHGADYLLIATRNPEDKGILTVKITDNKNRVLREVSTDQVAHNGYSALRFSPIIYGIETKLESPLIFKIECNDGCSLLSDSKTNNRDKIKSPQGGEPNFMLYKSMIPVWGAYAGWLSNNMPNAKELARQRALKFVNDPLISIVTPLYNTPERYLRDLLDSVVSQTYENWEFCLADGSDKDTNITEIIAEYNDSRIKYKKLEKNGGISENTNAAIEMSKGEYVAFLDHDDILAPHALFSYVELINENPDYELFYSDEDKVSDDGLVLKDPYFKSDYSPHLLLSHNYVTHFMMIKRSILDTTGYLNSAFDGAQDYDLVLRASERAKKIGHISDILYHWRLAENSTSSNADTKPYTVEAGRSAIKDALKRRNIVGYVHNIQYPNMYRVEYYITDPKPLISIIIPNKDEPVTLRTCIASIINNTKYANYEIIVVENGSSDKNVFEYYEELSKRENIRVIKWEKQFNYSAINNFAAQHANGNIFLFMNNDMTVINSDWLTQMAMQAMRPEVGVVGAKLLYPNNTLQHGGIISPFFEKRMPAHPYRGVPVENTGPFGRYAVINNVSAVTGACLMVRREIFEKVKGFDEELPVAYNDVDFCLKVRDLGLYNVYTPFAQLYHYESKTRGYEDTPEKIERLNSESEIFFKRWGEKSPCDPFYNRNLIMGHPGYEINPDKAPPRHNFEPKL